jgi:hypothetical protein
MQLGCRPGKALVAGAGFEGTQGVEVDGCFHDANFFFQ